MEWVIHVSVNRNEWIGHPSFVFRTIMFNMAHRILKDSQ